MRYTSTSLIKELEKFPKDTIIETELAFVFNYDSDKVLSEVPGKTFESEEEMYDVYKKYATELAIFEGSWEDNNISDLNNILPKYVIGWEPNEHCGPNAILKEDIITAIIQVYNGSDDKNMKSKLSLLIEILELTEDVEEINCKLNAQKEYAEKEHLPLFAPTYGLCFFCGKQIYNRISMEEAENELITHCPYCSRAYND